MNQILKAYAAAYNALPENAKWFRTNGIPGEAGWSAWYITPDGMVWIVSNGVDGSDWTCGRHVTLTVH
jgi:hypothetical protein